MAKSPLRTVETGCAQVSAAVGLTRNDGNYRGCGRQACSGREGTAAGMQAHAKRRVAAESIGPEHSPNHTQAEAARFGGRSTTTTARCDSAPLRGGGGLGRPVHKLVACTYQGFWRGERRQRLGQSD